MFKNLASVIASAFVMSGAITYAIPAPSLNTLQARSAALSPNVQVCTGSVGNGCITIPVSSDSCDNFTGGQSFLNKEVTFAVVPDGFVCTFYEQFGCLSDQGGADAVVLQGGTWNFFSVPGTKGGMVDFNDLSSSFICSPV